MNPLNLIPAPYRLIVTLGFVVAFLGSFYAYAQHRQFKADQAVSTAEKLAAVQKYQAEYQKAVERANILAQKLATRETEIVYRTKEVIKNVPKVTTGKPCLNSAAVRMLNHRGDSTVPETTGKPATESTNDAAATDTDTAYWIADAISQYEIAAARLNALVDYFEKSQ